jgi:N-acetylmuramic acid 6-phosphate (MurNAc-6-P) etherase
VETAIVMRLASLSRPDAEAKLEAAAGRIRRVIDVPPPPVA